MAGIANEPSQRTSQRTVKRRRQADVYSLIDESAHREKTPNGLVISDLSSVKRLLNIKQVIYKSIPISHFPINLLQLRIFKKWREKIKVGRREEKRRECIGGGGNKAKRDIISPRIDKNSTKPRTRSLTILETTSTSISTPPLSYLICFQLCLFSRRILLEEITIPVAYVNT